MTSTTTTPSSRELQLHEFYAELSCFQEQIKTLEKKEIEIMLEKDEIILLVLEVKEKLNELVPDFKHQK